ncbi:MAG: hypothetical protein WCA46_02065, partial [Actinocatenispora sp.]
LAASAGTAAPRHAGADPGARRSALSGAFDLSGPYTALLDEVPLHDETVLQSFAVDATHNRIYTLQLMQGGIQLPDESAPVSGADRDKAGDLCLTQLDLAGNELGYMYLTGFGHGVQMGVEQSVTGAYLWTETASDNEGGKDGWGTRLCRFAFSDGTVLDKGSVQPIQLVPGSDRTTVSVDTEHGLLILRYRLAGAFRFGVFRLADVHAGHYEAVWDVAQPGLSADFQGFTGYDSTLYLLSGTAYGTSGSTPPLGNTRITAVDLRTGEVTDDQFVPTAPDLAYREPEGMAVQAAGLGRPARLCFGFASGATGGRLASVYYVSAGTA